MGGILHTCIAVVVLLFAFVLGIAYIFEQKIQDLQNELASLKRKRSETKVELLDNTGSLFTRWGRSDCPTTATLIYKGYTGGSLYTHKGAASNYLCLPENPQWGTRSLNNFQAFVYGAEYENNFFGENALQQDVPCRLAFMLEHKFQELEEELVYLKRNYKTLETECDMLKSKVESYDHVFSKVNGSLKEQVRVIQTDVGSLKIQMENLKQAALNTGSVFTRWGRSDCPATSTLIYKGYAGGSWYNHKGAASNFLCLPENPQWGTRSLNNFQAFVYGAEYENNFFGGNAHQQDVPCIYTCGSWYCHKGAASYYLWLPETPQWGIRSPNNFQAFVYGA
uniref:Uncharacterized protein n=1 Tax=Magallana gigas TaxID=29159 RepID=A0A8W8JL03_MAGGI